MKRCQHGFTFVEIIIALGLAAILLPALGRALSFSIRVASQGEKFSQAYALAQQGMENIYAQKSQDWASLANSTIVVLPFTRTIQISPITRDISGNISGTGTSDPNTKFVHVIVSWPESVGTQQITLDSYVTNH